MSLESPSRQSKGGDLRNDLVNKYSLEVIHLFIVALSFHPLPEVEIKSLACHVGCCLPARKWLVVFIQKKDYKGNDKTGRSRSSTRDHRKTCGLMTFTAAHSCGYTHTLVRSFWSIINGISAVKTYKHRRSLPSAHAPHVFREFPFDRQVT